MKVKFSLSIGLAGCSREDIIDYEDDITDEELQEDYEEWVWRRIDGGFERLTDSAD